MIGDNANTGAGAFGLEHGDDIARGPIAKKLAESLLVIGNAMPLDKCDEIAWCVPGERGAGEVRIRREKSIRGAVEVGEIAAASAGDEYLFADLVGMIEDQDAAASLTRRDGGHESRGAGTEDEHVTMFFLGT